MALDPVAVALKFGFLLVLYLFLLWVSRSALRDLRRGDERDRSHPGPPPPDATGLHTATSPGGADAPQLVVERAPGHTPGLAYDIGDGAILGRGDAAEIR